jgi:hypothetical protein
VNVVITNSTTDDPIARYEIHLRDESNRKPPDREYFDDAWTRAVADGLVEDASRANYRFQLQRPKTLYESSE